MFVIKMDVHDLRGNKNGFVTKLRKTIKVLSPKYKVVPPTAFLRSESSTRTVRNTLMKNKDDLDYFIHKWEKDLDMEAGNTELYAEEVVILDELV